jgi:hypothetical protein
LEQPVEEGSDSGLRLVRPWRLLLAHDAAGSTCDVLVGSLDAALGSVDLAESSSVVDARLSSSTTQFDLALVCLDLPPAPLGGVRLAEELVVRKMPVVLVTRSLRWIPASAVTVRALPWIPPDAPPEEIARAIREGMALAVAARRDAAAPSARRTGHAG